MVYIIPNTEIVRLQKALRRTKLTASCSASVESVDQEASSEQEQRLRRRVSFEDAKETTFAQFSETFQRLADAG